MALVAYRPLGTGRKKERGRNHYRDMPQPFHNPNKPIN